MVRLEERDNLLIASRLSTDRQGNHGDGRDLPPPAVEPLPAANEHEHVSASGVWRRG